MATFNASGSYGYPQVLAGIVPYWSAAAAVAVLFDSSAITAITLVATVTERSTHHRGTINSLARAYKPLSCASKSADGQTSPNHCHQSPSGNTKSVTSAYAIKPKNSKLRPS